MSDLGREVLKSEQVYSSLATQYAALAANQSSRIRYHQIIDQPTLPSAPVSPNKFLIYGMSLFLSLLVGCVGAFLVDILRAKVRTKADLEQYARTPILNVITKKEWLNDRDWTMAGLTANLLLLLRERKRGVVISFSATTTPRMVSQLTESLSKWLPTADYKVLLISLDNKYNLDKLAMGQTENGLRLDNQLLTYHTATPNMDVLAYHDLTTLSQNILHSQKLPAVLEHLRTQYDFIIIAAPRVSIGGSDTLLRACDANMMVLQPNTITVRRLKVIDAYLENYAIPNAFWIMVA